MSSRIDDLLGLNQAALRVRAARHELIASNIANADTPGFKARDIDFASALKGAMSGTEAKLAMAVTASNHLAGGDGKTVMGAPLMYRNAAQPSADGNTVDMDVELAQFADNALRYEASVQFVSSKIKTMLSVIQGQ